MYVIKWEVFKKDDNIIKITIYQIKQQFLTIVTEQFNEPNATICIK